MKGLPEQKIKRGQKTEEWGIECINHSISNTLDGIYTRRSSKYKKLRNYRLYNGIFEEEDMERPDAYGLKAKGFTFPAKMECYPIHIPIFDLLIGEESKRPFNWTVKAVNDTAVSLKDNELKKLLQEKIQEIVFSSNIPEEQVEQELGNFTKYLQYSWKSAYESTAHKLLKHFDKELGLEEVFLQGWEDVLIAGEEIYKVYIQGGRPKVKRCNPVEIYAKLPHNEYKLDKADIIVENTYATLSEILDEYWDVLTPAEISQLEESYGNMTGDEWFNPSLMVGPDEDYDSEHPLYFGNTFEDGDKIRVCHVTWRSFKLIYERLYVDELGLEQSDIVGENYVKQSNDIKLKPIWINEYWEGTKIGNDVYINIRPKYSQLRKMDNLSLCYSGYVGTVYNANNAQSVSLMDRIIPWLYMYFIVFYNTELLISANYGTIALMDISTIPDEWDPDKWMYYAKSMKIGWIDSMKESQKGQRHGGQNQNATSKTLDFNTGNTINQYIQLLEFIENKLKQLSGVTDQRMGSISASEGVGNTQRAVVQSSHITEKWFNLHNLTKGRVLSTLLEIVKDWVGEDSMKLQYITDDLAAEIFEIEGKEYSSCDYDIFVSSSGKDQELIDNLNGLMQAAMQNDQVTLYDLSNILGNTNVADIKAKLKEATERSQANKMEQIKAQNASMEQANAIQARMADIKEQELELAKYEIDENNLTKINVAEIQVYARQQDIDQNDNGTPDFLELEKFKSDSSIKNRKLNLEERKLEYQKIKDAKDQQLKEKQINKKSNK